MTAWRSAIHVKIQVVLENIEEFISFFVTTTNSKHKGTPPTHSFALHASKYTIMEAKGGENCGRHSNRNNIRSCIIRPIVIQIHIYRHFLFRVFPKPNKRVYWHLIKFSRYYFGRRQINVVRQNYTTNFILRYFSNQSCSCHVMLFRATALSTNNNPHKNVLFCLMFSTTL